MEKKILNYFDSDHLADVVKGASFELKQLDKGSFTANLFTASLNAGVLDRGCYNLSVLTQGTFSQEYMTFGFIHQADNVGRLNGEAIQPYDIVLSHENGNLDYSLAPNTLWSAFQCKREDLLKTGVEIPKESVSIFQLDKEAQRYFDFELTSCSRYLEELHYSQYETLNQQMLYNHLLATYAKSLNYPALHIEIKKNDAYQMAQTIYNYLHEHSSEPIQMIELTQLTGKSERTIERIFKKYFNITPYTYLKLHRLHLVHHKLMCGDPSTNITHLAMSHGFMHMGYFGQEYKKMYAQTPSDTLNKQMKISL